MASLNQLADLIANTFGKYNDHEFKERIKDRIKFLNATLIRRTFDKHGTDEELIIPLKFQLEEVVDPAICIQFGITNKKCTILKTKNKVPTPLRTVSTPIFNYIGVLDGTIPFYKARKFEIKPLRKERLNNNQIFVVYENKYFYIIGNIQIEFMRADAVYINLDEFNQLCDPDSNCYNDYDEYPIPLDIIDIIIKELEKEYSAFFNIKTNNEIENK